MGTDPARTAKKVAGHNEHRRCALRVTACLCLALCAVGGRSGAADEIHHFVDDRGVHHFSNVPADPRYRPYLRAAAEAGINATTDRPSVILFAPPLVAPGSEFAVNVLLSAPADVYGWVDIAFDPAARTLGAASVEHELPSANIVRVKVHGGPSAEFSADLQFRANASQSSSTRITLAQSDLRTGGGNPVTARKPPATQIGFLSLGQ